jgi:alkylation response protein AidB-like acyl-CoA dehydrogenase
LNRVSVEQELIVQSVRRFVEREVMPVASAMEHRDEYPQAFVDKMVEIGLFGLNVPEQYGGTGSDHTTQAMILEELARGWLGLSGILSTHLVLCHVVNAFGTSQQKEHFLPVLARGKTRGAVCLSEAGAGTDLQGILTTATRDDRIYRINGSKMWITNARHAGVFLLLAKTDAAVRPAHKGMSAFLVDKTQTEFAVGRDIEKLGYKGLETCEVHFDNSRVPVENLVGGTEGEGFRQVMTGLETERINVAARGLGVARSAFEHAIEYAQHRVTFGKPIAERQTIQIKLADMATEIEASRLLIYSAAEKKDRGERCDMECGMAKLFAGETAVRASLEAMRILGGNGYSKDFPVERYYRDAPVIAIAGGSSELQRLIIARRLLEKYRVDGR